MKKILLSGLVASALTVSVHAENKLTTHTELGFIDTQGNTQTQTFNLDSKVTKNIDKHLFAFTVDAQYATVKDEETKNKYVAELNYDYSVTDRFAFGYLLGLKQDKFSGYDYQLYTGPTLQYKAIISEAHNLNLSGNILYTQDQVENADNTNEYAAYGLGLAYAWQIQETLKFAQDLGYRAEFEDTENYFATSKTSLISKISDVFSAGLSYKVAYANILVAQYHTDKTFTANLIIDY